MNKFNLYTPIKLIIIIISCLIVVACQSYNARKINFSYGHYGKNRALVRGYLEKNDPYAAELFASRTPRRVQIGIAKYDINNDGYRDILASPKHHTYFCNKSGCPIYLFVYEPNTKIWKAINFDQPNYVNTYHDVYILPTRRNGSHDIAVTNSNAEQSVWCWDSHQYINCKVIRQGFHHTDPPLQYNSNYIK